MLWGSVSVYSIFSHRVLSNVKCSRVMLPLPDCHSHNLRMVISLPSIQLFQHLRDLALGLLQHRFLRLQSFSPSECQDINPADQGVVVQGKACQCYLLCLASDQRGMTVLFQTWPTFVRICPWCLALWQLPLWKSNQVLSGVSIVVFVLG